MHHFLQRYNVATITFCDTLVYCRAIMHVIIIAEVTNIVSLAYKCKYKYHIHLVRVGPDKRENTIIYIFNSILFNSIPVSNKTLQSNCNHLHQIQEYILETQDHTKRHCLYNNIVDPSNDRNNDS